MAKVSTKLGDDGYTSLWGSQRVAKYSARPEAYGTLDEASSALGLARAAAMQVRVKEAVYSLQQDLYVMMAELATPAEDYERSAYRIEASHVQRLDILLEELKQETEIQRRFITPGDTLAGAALDVARTVIRRAERIIARLLHEEEIPNPEVLRYLNRLSDVVFVLGRYEEERALKSR
ncbi:MAG: cob(I)yrinic acid a,c-diamide adenosyltransferase [Chloroflexota bacterium]|nr:cob(I)yrinic acid a,c-diamide adenosyltransferase [Chloroflexota bacterium]